MSISEAIRDWFNKPIMTALRQMQARETQLMAALADLQAAEAAIQSSINAAITLIQQMQAGSVSDADVEAVVSKLTADAAALNAVVTLPTP